MINNEWNNEKKNSQTQGKMKSGELISLMAVH